MILDRQIRTILNLHTIERKHRPFHLGMIDPLQHSIFIKKELHNTCDFFQPIEGLKGQCLANFYIRDPSQFLNQYYQIKQRIKKNIKQKKAPISSLIENQMNRMKLSDATELRQYLKAHNMLRRPLQVTYDLYGSSPLHRAMSMPMALQNESKAEVEDMYQN